MFWKIRVAICIYYFFIFNIFNQVELSTIGSSCKNLTLFLVQKYKINSKNVLWYKIYFYLAFKYIDMYNIGGISVISTCRFIFFSSSFEDSNPVLCSAWTQIQTGLASFQEDNLQSFNIMKILIFLCDPMFTIMGFYTI